MDRVKQDLIDRIDHLVTQALAVSFVVPDETGFFSIEDESITQVRELLERATKTLLDASDLYEEEHPAPPTPTLDSGDVEDLFLLEIGAAISSELASREIASLAFATRAQLYETIRALDHALKQRNIWAVASHVDTGHRRLTRGLIGLESAIRDFEHLPPKTRLWSDVQDSLETRRLYSQFRRAVSQRSEAQLEAADDLEALKQHLKHMARRIVIVRQSQIYPYLRIDDRVPFRRLQQRIAAWLETSNEPADRAAVLREGQHLWSDLESFRVLRQQVNLREDLREHDRRLVIRLYRLLFQESVDPAQRLDSSQLADLDPLLGRDDSLDDILRQPHQHTLEDLREPLGRLRSQLNRPYAEQTPSPLASL